MRKTEGHWGSWIRATLLVVSLVAISAGLALLVSSMLWPINFFVILLTLLFIYVPVWLIVAMRDNKLKGNTLYARSMVHKAIFLTMPLMPIAALCIVYALHSGSPAVFSFWVVFAIGLCVISLVFATWLSVSNVVGDGNSRIWIPAYWLTGALSWAVILLSAVFVTLSLTQVVHYTDIGATEKAMSFRQALEKTSYRSLGDVHTVRYSSMFTRFPFDYGEVSPDEFVVKVTSRRSDTDGSSTLFQRAVATFTQSGKCVILVPELSAKCLLEDGVEVDITQDSSADQRVSVIIRVQQALN